AAVTPMISVSGGLQIGLTTPFGQRGWFWRAWQNEEVQAKRFRVTWRECPRHRAEFIDSERRLHGDSWVAQEYECSFESLSGLAYPDFVNQCGVDFEPPPLGKRLGGIDFGYRNPFAAIYGTLTLDDVLWINDERYLREVTLLDHAKHLPKPVTWFADPAGA